MKLLLRKVTPKIWLSALIVGMLSSCRSLDATKTTTAQPSWHTEHEDGIQGKFAPALKDDKYVLRLVRSGLSENIVPGGLRDYIFNVRFFTDEYFRKTINIEDHYQKNAKKYKQYVSFHHLHIVSERLDHDWFTFQMCEYRDTGMIKTHLETCWFPFLNRSRYPVPIEAGLIALDELTAADGTDLILGEVKALWRSESADYSDYKEVESVKDVLKKIDRFQKKIWNIDDYHAKITKTESSSAIREIYDEDLAKLLDTKIAYKCTNDAYQVISENVSDDPVLCSPTGR